MSSLLGDEVRHLLHSNMKKKNSGSTKNMQNINFSHGKPMKTDGLQENDVGSKTHQKIAENNNEEDSRGNKTRNFHNASEGPLTDKTITNVHQDLKNSSILKVSNNTTMLPGHKIEATWITAMPGNATLQNKNVTDAENTSIQKPDGKVSGKII